MISKDQAALEFRAVGKRYGAVEAVRDVSLTIAPRQFVALVGASGSGKSTLLKTINRLAEADSGEVIYTRVHCHLLDGQSCRCSDYPNRLARVPDCVRLTPDNCDDLDWLPEPPTTASGPIPDDTRA